MPQGSCVPPHSQGAKTQQERKGEAVGFLTEPQYLIGASLPTVLNGQKGAQRRADNS